MKASIFPDQAVILHHAAEAEIPVIYFVVIIKFFVHVVCSRSQKIIIDLEQIIFGMRDAYLQQPVQLSIFIV